MISLDIGRFSRWTPNDLMLADLLRTERSQEWWAGAWSEQPKMEEDKTESEKPHFRQREFKNLRPPSSSHQGSYFTYFTRFLITQVISTCLISLTFCIQNSIPFLSDSLVILPGLPIPTSTLNANGFYMDALRAGEPSSLFLCPNLDQSLLIPSTIFSIYLVLLSPIIFLHNKMQ